MQNTYQQAKQKAAKIFTKPGLLSRVEEIQERFNEPQIDGHQLLDLLNEALVEQSEWQFEQDIRPFPFVVEIPKKKFTTGKYRLNAVGDPSPLFEEAEHWLAKNIPSGEYLAFPNNASHRYKDCYFNVYFKTSQWAVYFKVGFPL